MKSYRCVLKTQLSYEAKVRKLCCCWSFQLGLGEFYCKDAGEFDM
jgi:hypothetical protein